MEAKRGTIMERIHGQGTGWFAAPNTIFHRPEIGPYAKLVYLYLCRRGGPDGCAWPSLTTIAEDCGVSKDTITKAIKVLEAEKCIRVQRIEDEQRGHLSNRYHFLPLAVPSGPLDATAATPLSVGAATLAAEAGSKDDHVKDDQDQKDTPSLAAQKKPRAKHSYSEGFEAWWKHYPKPVGKYEAFQEWEALGSDRPPLESLIAAVEAQKKSDKWNQGYILDACRWLKRRRWEDAPTPTHVPTAPPNPVAAQLASGMALAQKLRERGL